MRVHVLLRAQCKNVGVQGVFTDANFELAMKLLERDASFDSDMFLFLETVDVDDPDAISFVKEEIQDLE